MLCFASSAIAIGADSTSAPWTDANISLDVARQCAFGVVCATSTGEATIVSRETAELATSQRVNGGEVIEGGCTVTDAHCTQDFDVKEVLSGEWQRERRNFKYSFVEKRDGFPGPQTGAKIPANTAAILILNETGILWALPDTDQNRKLVEKFKDDVNANVAESKLYAALVKHAGELKLEFRYVGDTPAAFKTVVFTVSNPPAPGAMGMDRPTALKLLDWLHRAGLFKQAIATGKGIQTPRCDLCISASAEISCIASLGWNEKLSDRLKDICLVMQCAGAFDEIVHALPKAP